VAKYDALPGAAEREVDAGGMASAFLGHHRHRCGSREAEPGGGLTPLSDASGYYFDANGRSFDITPSGAFLLVKPPPRRA
jgi:hypothetical protein